MVSEWSGRNWRCQRPELGVRTGQWVLLMNTASASVSIVGAPVACADGVKETWRDLAGWFAGQLRTRYGEQVEVTYYDLFDPVCPPLPPGAQLPVVLVNSQVITNGGKLSMPAIRTHLEAMGLRPAPVGK